MSLCDTVTKNNLSTISRGYGLVDWKILQMQDTIIWISSVEQEISNDEVWSRYTPGVANAYAPASYLLNIKDDRIP